MTLFSTKDDFCRTTLEAVPGVFGKLDYLANLRVEDGRYQHWGLSRVYGDEAMQRAISEAHHQVFLEVLRMPVRKLLEDLACASRAKDMDLLDFIEDLARRSPALLPADLGGGSVRHFNSVVAALLSLVRNSRAATPAGA